MVGAKIETSKIETRLKKMKRWNDISGLKRWVIAGVGIAGATVALYFTVYATEVAANNEAEHRLHTLETENVELERFRPRLQELEGQIAQLKEKMESGRRVIPDEKEAAALMDSLSHEAHSAGVEVRRYTARPVAQHDFYAEVPFELELDGSYYNMLQFFQHVAAMDRLVNITGLQLASTQSPQDAKAKRTYHYSTGETVVATCVATGFYGQVAPVPVAASKPGTVVPKL